MRGAGKGKVIMSDYASLIAFIDKGISEQFEDWFTTTHHEEWHNELKEEARQAYIREHRGQWEHEYKTELRKRLADEMKKNL